MPKRPKEGNGVKVAIVVSEFNYDVTLLMLERAKEEVSFLGASLGPVMKTPGVFDMPLAAKVLLGRDDVDAL
ncbi:MAG TPA: 6,7-dimethyl-8-ribityllumazine synthase, partial [Thermoplasmata archaeon]